MNLMKTHAWLVLVGVGLSGCALDSSDSIGADKAVDESTYAVFLVELTQDRPLCQHQTVCLTAIDLELDSADGSERVTQGHLIELARTRRGGAEWFLRDTTRPLATNLTRAQIDSLEVKVFGDYDHEFVSAALDPETLSGRGASDAPAAQFELRVQQEQTQSYIVHNPCGGAEQVELEASDGDYREVFIEAGSSYAVDAHAGERLKTTGLYTDSLTLLPGDTDLSVPSCTHRIEVLSITDLPETDRDGERWDSLGIFDQSTPDPYVVATELQMRDQSDPITPDPSYTSTAMDMLDVSSLQQPVLLAGISGAVEHISMLVRDDDDGGDNPAIVACLTCPVPDSEEVVFSCQCERAPGEPRGQVMLRRRPGRATPVGLLARGKE